MATKPGLILYKIKCMASFVKQIHPNSSEEFRSNFQLTDITREMQQAEWHHPSPLVDAAVGHQDPLHPWVLRMLADDYYVSFKGIAPS